MPFEFCVIGTPRSAQATGAGKQAWKKAIHEVAFGLWPSNAPPVEGSVAIAIDHFVAGSAPDVDNIIKPIQDALIGLVYVDDSQVASTRARRRDLDGYFRARGMSLVLAEAFSSGAEFIHLRISEWADDGSLQ